MEAEGEVSEMEPVSEDPTDRERRRLRMNHSLQEKLENWQKEIPGRAKCIVLGYCTVI